MLGGQRQDAVVERRLPDDPLPLEAGFDGGRLTSDSGLVWLAEAEAVLGLCAALAAEVPEWRRGPDSVVR